MSDSMTDQEFQDTILRQTDLGQQALEKHEISKAFDYLLIPSLFNARARRLFLMIPNTHTRLFLLNEEQVARLKETSDQQYPLHQYAYGRYLQILQPDDNAIGEAIKLFEAAKDDVPDALCALAYLVKDGHCGQVNLRKYNELLDQAFQKDSMLANRKICLRRIYGQDGVEANPQFVVDSINKMLEGEESEDIAVVDPVYYMTLGSAYNELKDLEKSEKYFLKAIRMGQYEAYYRYCLMYDECSKADEKEKQETYLAMLDEGCKHDDPGCYFFRALFNMEHYEDFGKKAQKRKTVEIKTDLETAIKLGYDNAPYLLGRAYYYGYYGFKEDNTEAWNLFTEGSHREDPNAFTMLAQMIYDKTNPYEVPDGLKCFYELSALRRGDDDRIMVVMDYYFSGRLDYARDEVYSIYMSKYEKTKKEFHDRFWGKKPKDPDKPPMNLIAIIKPDGKAFIHEYNVEEDWDDLPPMIDARRLDAIRTQPLYDISKKMHYTDDHITAWVDNRGLLRGLPENRIGCMLYPGSIVGDLILTLEDNRYDPKSFDDLDDLKKILAELGANLIAVYLDDGPDDDGRFDAWS